ncbi:legume-like lectin family-domain-containing protein [Obelidium mucronatum]|nr:legume-like lectin family-domain-containing protein [Obelidium mucronatum]
MVMVYAGERGEGDVRRRREDSASETCQNFNHLADAEFQKKPKNQNKSNRNSNSRDKHGTVDIDFKVHGKAGAFHGDGFAFWYTKGRQTKGPVFGNQDKFEGLGVIFDTFKNGKHDYTFPYVSVQIGDGITGYDFKTDGKSGEAGGCIAADFRNRAFKTVARVEYVAGDYLKVLLNVKGNDQWEECALIKDVTLPSYGYLGFTSHTGAASGTRFSKDRHDIIRVSSNGMTNAKSYAPKKPQQQQQTQQQSARNNKNNNNAKVLRSTGGNLDSQNDGGLFERAVSDSDGRVCALSCWCGDSALRTRR